MRVRVTGMQRKMFEAAAHGAGLDVSTWLRLVSVREAKRMARGENR